MKRNLIRVPFYNYQFIEKIYGNYKEVYEY